jgi:predicted bacteriocin transport accessory protein
MIYLFRFILNSWGEFDMEKIQNHKNIFLSIFVVLPIMLSLIVLVFYNKAKEEVHTDLSTTSEIQVSDQNSQLNTTQKNRYLEYTNNFSTIEPNQLNDIIDNESPYVYFGRVTCSYCRAFVPNLANMSSQKNILIYYIDTENTDSDPDIQAIRKKYSVDSVPSLIKITQGNSDTFISYNTQDGINELDKFLSN